MTWDSFKDLVIFYFEDMKVLNFGVLKLKI